MQTCDVLIIGAGMAGASAAYEIAPFARVVVVERESQPGYHATGRSAALFDATLGTAVTRALTRASEAFFQSRLDGLSEQPVLGPRGVTVIARADQLGALDAREAAAASRSDQIERLTPAELHARLPIFRDGYVAAAFHDPSILDLDVAAIHQGYLRGLKARGGHLVTDAEVTRITTAAAPWRVDTRAGTFEAAVVVDAAGAWADQIAHMAEAPPLDLVAKRRTAFVFESSLDPDPTWPAIDDADETFYLKPESGGFLGSPADATPVAPADVQPEDLDVAQAADRIERATRLRVLRIRRKWAGLRTFAADDVPVVGMDEMVPGFFWLAGQGGIGIQAAPALARAAATLLVDGVVPTDLLAAGVTAEQLLPLRLRPRRG